ncbi:MAG: hypothetical protein DRJ56_08455 [Thermoprotei archaeon]|nr:MAG: hypothetical protein DRJ56_08455 [Thermoprotei archaeon]
MREPLVVEVLADDREESGGVIEELRRLGATVYIRRLELGDYVVSEDVVVERKTANDFIASIIDRRLFEQARSLLRAFERVIMVVEGDLWSALRWRGVTYKHVLGALSSLALMGVSVVPTSGPRETAYLVYNLARKLQVDEGKRVRVSPTKLRMAKGGKTVREAQLNVIASIPGISYELAERILEHFGTPRRFFAAHPHELRKVRGLGEKRVRKIIEVLDTNCRTGGGARADLSDYLGEGSKTNSQ